jgi:hypothetical protein
MNRDDDDDAWFCFRVVVFVLCFLVFGFRGLLVGPSRAVEALETQGYSNIQVVDRKWFLVCVRGCDGGDGARFDVKATNPVGKQVHLFVCVGWPFKGATIRTE